MTPVMLSAGGEGFLFVCLFVFLGPHLHPGPVEVPRLGV